MTPAVERIDRDGVAELRLTRPERRNALNTEMLTELRLALRDIQDDPACRIVLLTGAGASFCAGADLHEFADGASSEGRLRRIRLVAEVLSRLGELQQPTIAAVQGAVVGAGWGLALACDLCLAARDATFCLPELAKGYRIPEVLMRRLIAVVGPMRAADLAFSGAIVDADQALAAGCVTRVLESAEHAQAEAHDLCAALATRPARSVATAKQPLRALPSPIPFPPPDLNWNED